MILHYGTFNYINLIESDHYYLNHFFYFFVVFSEYFAANIIVS
jgi:hypothetical protein